ncbi:MAG: DUF4013 domain-containing protein [Oceanospirillaceae bacterium]|nr:DUF4013 domain-containing protein [Oceanospirillaceae bacterium]MCP5350120.1 DUF4013 domain-containing protein [Oceanospirillaceae bacterium]
MEYCKYHPLKPATWQCTLCATHACDVCCDESPYKDEGRCLRCGGRLESLGAAYTVEPFWHNLKEIFRYPLSPQVLVLIVLVSAIDAVLSFLPIMSVVGALMAAGIFTKYSFQCLQKTAEGEMVAPDITDAYRGGIILVLKLVLLAFVILLVGGFLIPFIGVGLVSLLAMLVLFAVPAFLINYALTQSIVRSLRPASILSIVMAVGMPYGILISLIFLMFTSVDVLSYFVISDAQWLTKTLQSMIANYYMVVVFHMLGYVVFQYQKPLGFYARVKTAEAPVLRSQNEKFKAQVSVAVKEGQYDKVASLYQSQIKQYNEMETCDSWFEFLYRSANRELLADYAERYLNMKIKNGYKDQATKIHRQIQQVIADYIPQDAQLCHELAQLYFNAGDYAKCVSLINCLQKKSKDIALLVRAFMLMANALDEMNKQEQALKCRQFVAQLQRSQ